ncbi:ORC2-like protein [Mya arenaria]|uniref:Origin recognition complex subunit 2 n=1 Tax=Mya arenaria TaxID=6604 RepID=A0ABY7EA34_MYAAR|nr:ORC2-like protein [Mya arenaria]
MFRTPKKSGKMAQLASETRTPKSILKTPKSKEGTPGKCNGNSDSEESLDTSDSDSDGSDDQPLSTLTTPKGATPSTSTAPIARAPRRKTEETDMPLFLQKTSVEDYFDIHSSDVGPTSDATLAKLDLPHLDQKSLTTLLTGVESSHQAECRQLYKEHSEMNTTLSGFSQLVVNGYFPSLSVKHILNSITEDILDHSGSFKSPLDQVEFIKTEFEKRYDVEERENPECSIPAQPGSQHPHHSLGRPYQLLTHLFLRISHFMNTFTVWDQTKCCRFRWLWYDATTFAPYTEETSYENSLLVQQTGGLAMSSLTHVMKSLTPNAKGIFLLLAKYQMENKDNANYIGMSLHDLYQRCRESFLVNSDLTLQAQLTEFRDHKMIRSKKVGTEIMQQINN